MRGNLHIGPLVAVLAALALACCLSGCNKRPLERIPDNPWKALGGERPIRFHSGVSAASTKADATFVDGEGVTGIPQDQSIGVFAFYQEGDVANGTAASWNSTRIPDFMFNMQVTNQGTDAAPDFQYTPLYYWPSNIENTISFWAYYPYSSYKGDNTGALQLFSASDGVTAYSATSAGLPVARYTVDTDPSKQSDLLFDTFDEDRVRNRTYQNTTDYTVPFTFRHALSRVEFKIRKDEETMADFEIKLTSIKVEKLYPTGTYTIGSGWSGQTGDRGDMTVFSGTQDVTTTATAAGDILLPLPQELDNLVNIHIEYQQKKGTVPAEKLSRDYLVNKTGHTAWVEGGRYVYTLTILQYGLYVKPTILPWEDTGEFSFTSKFSANASMGEDTYKYIDLDGSSTTWDDQYVMVSYGYVDADNHALPAGATVTEHYRPQYGSRFNVTSTSEGTTLQLHLDNSNFKFVTYQKRNEGGVEYDEYNHSYNDVITLPLGENMVTTFYVVPKTALPVSATLEQRSCHVYVTTAGSGVASTKLTFAGALPGGTPDSSEIWFYYVTPDQYASTGETVTKP